MSDAAGFQGPEAYQRRHDRDRASDLPFSLPPIQLPPAAANARHGRAEAIPATMTFRPRRATRRMLTVILTVWVAASAFATLEAWRAPSEPAIGMAAAIIALTALTWVVRAGTSVARVSLRGGILDIHKGGQRTTFSLRDNYQLIDVVGRPGRPGWKVLFHRHDHPSFVIDSSLVEPREFMRVLRHYRPEL